MAAPYSYVLSLCAIARNEAAYFVEWIEFHRLLGVEHFVIYDNSSTDDTREVLRPYVKRGLVEYIFWPEHPGQLSAYDDCLKRLVTKTLWLGFIDLDEYIVPMHPGSLPEFLKSYEGTNGLGINWVMYGPGPHKTQPSGLQVESYLYRRDLSHISNFHIKSIVDPRRTIRAIDPHHFLFKDDGSVLDENGDPISKGAFTSQNRTSRIRINHYYTRSEEEFERKIKRGRATVKKHIPANAANPTLYAELSKYRDEAALRFLPALKQAIRCVSTPLEPSLPKEKLPPSPIEKLHRFLAGERKIRSPLGGITDALPILKRVKAQWRQKRRKSQRLTRIESPLETAPRKLSSLTSEIREQMCQRAALFENPPLISVIVPVYNPKPTYLEACLRSVFLQTYPHWELCIADDASSDPEIRKIIERFQKSDPRVRVVFRPENGNICQASNSALELASGDFVAPLDHDDELAEDALFHVADTILRSPDAEIVYSDEDKINSKGLHFGAYFKPDWSPDLLCSQNYICHLMVLKRSLVERLGGFRASFEGSQDHDLILRASRITPHSRIHHIPRILYHWRLDTELGSFHTQHPARCLDAGLRAVNEHVQAIVPGARAELSETGLDYRVIWPLDAPEPLVTILIPTTVGNKAVLHTCLTSLLEKTNYSNFEILLIINNAVEPEVFEYASELSKSHSRLRWIEDKSEFNYSEIHNRAATQANGEVLALVNDDIEVLSPDWLRDMVSYVVQERIGAVGAKLFYPGEDRRIQHAGVACGMGGAAGHSFKYFRDKSGAHQRRPEIAHNVSAVTAACLVVRKSVYLALGGLDSSLAVAFNDIDFCLRVRDAGYLNVYVPEAKLIHHESLTRGYATTAVKRTLHMKEARFMRRRWGKRLLEDPFYNPNLTLIDGSHQAAAVSRVKDTWKESSPQAGLAAASQALQTSCKDFILSFDKTPTSSDRMLRGWVAANRAVDSVLVGADVACQLEDRPDVYLRFDGKYWNCVGFYTNTHGADSEIPSIKIQFEDES